MPIYRQVTPLLNMVSIGALQDPEEYKRRVDDTVTFIKNGKKAPGVTGILVPGEQEK